MEKSPESLAEEQAKAINAFANRILPEWDRAMDSFFEVVDRRRRDTNLSDEDVKAALEKGYGYEVADAWEEWVRE